MKLPGNHGYAAVTDREESKTALRNPRREKVKREKKRRRRECRAGLKLQIYIYYFSFYYFYGFYSMLRGIPLFFYTEHQGHWSMTSGSCGWRWRKRQTVGRLQLWVCCVKVWLVWKLWVRMSKSERLILWAPMVQVDNHDLYGHDGSRSTHRGLWLFVGLYL